MFVHNICDFVSTHRPHIALWLMLYGIGMCVNKFVSNDSFDTIVYGSGVHPPPSTSITHILYFIGYTQLSAYMLVDTVGNWLSPRPRAEIYIHHGVCGLGLLASFVNGLTWPPLTIFGILEIITVCRFIDDTTHEPLFCWMRILTTLFMRVPVSGVGAYLAYQKCVLHSFSIDNPMVRLYFVWGIICAAVLPFDCYLMTLYVKRLRKKRKSI
jgi:hypothetical protein